VPEAEAAEEEGGIQNQKQEPHTKMWGKSPLMAELKIGESIQLPTLTRRKYQVALSENRLPQIFMIHHHVPYQNNYFGGIPKFLGSPKSIKIHCSLVKYGQLPLVHRQIPGFQHVCHGPSTTS